MKSLLVLYFQVLNPFYIFQIASIILWSLDSYYYYAACIFLISCISMAVSLYETKRVSIVENNLHHFLFCLCGRKTRELLSSLDRCFLSLPLCKSYNIAHHSRSIKDFNIKLGMLANHDKT